MMPPRRGWVTLLAALLLGLSAGLFAQVRQVPVPPMDSPVIDTTGTLDATTRSQLQQRALELQARKGSQLQVLMIPTTGDEPIEDYAIRAFEAFKLGRDKVDDGVLLLVAKDDRKVRIEVGYGLEGAIPDITAGRVISEYMAPHFREGDFGGGLLAATERLERLIDGEPLPEPLAHAAADAAGTPGWLDVAMAALFPALVVAMILRGVFSGQSAGIRGLLAGAGAGGIAWMLSSLLLVGGVGALLGFLLGLMAAPSGRYAHDRGWGGMPGGSWGGSSPGGWGGSSSGGWGGSSGGGMGGGMGGGWSGGGGRSGGGGASGGW